MEELVLERDNEVLTYGTDTITEQISIPERQIRSTEWLLDAGFIDYWQHDQVFGVEVCVCAASSAVNQRVKWILCFFQ